MARGQLLKIGELARLAGANARTIRFYERIGLLPEPQRSPSGYRLYSEEDARLLRFIKTAQRLGFTLGEVKEILAFRYRGEPPCQYVAAAIEGRLLEIDQRMRDMRALRQDLRELRRRIRQGEVVERETAICHFIESAAEPFP